VPREVLKWALMRKGVPKTYINVVEHMYERSCISFKSMCEETKDFKVRIGVHQESALNTYLFSVVMDEVTTDIQGKYYGA